MARVFVRSRQPAATMDGRVTELERYQDYIIETMEHRIGLLEKRLETLEKKEA